MKKCDDFFELRERYKEIFGYYPGYHIFSKYAGHYDLFIAELKKCIEEHREFDDGISGVCPDDCEE